MMRLSIYAREIFGILAKIVLLTSATAAFVTCSDDEGTGSSYVTTDVDLQTFKVATDCVGVYNVGVAIEKIDTTDEQICQSDQGRLMRVVTNEGNLTFSLELSDGVASLGDEAEVVYASTSTTSTHDSLSSTVTSQLFEAEVVKVDDGYVWLWDAESKVGFVIPEW